MMSMAAEPRNRNLAEKGAGGFRLVGQAGAAWDVAALLLATGGRLLGSGQAATLGSVSTDTRGIRPGDIFLALAGERFDGHDFLDKAVRCGAAALVVSRALKPLPAVPVVLVEDTLKALGDLAAFHRAALQNLRVVAITGSTGKTTVKEMAAAILGREFRVLKTEGNRNNLVGLPLSLLPAEADHEVAVLELGMNRPGEIARLTEIADPDVACIVNVQAAHLEGLGDIEGVARAKGELFGGLHDGATMVVNDDDPRVTALAAAYPHKKVRFGADPQAEVRATHIRSLGEGGMAFTLHVLGEKRRVSLRGPGVHNVGNALAAAAIAHAVGLGIESIAAGLEGYIPFASRLEIRTATGGVKLINDTYNANPGSMRAALATLVDLADVRKKVAVLGDMLELGEESGPAHWALGVEAARLGCDALLTVGEFARKTVEGARSAGMDPRQAKGFTDKAEVVAQLQKLMVLGDLVAGDWILVKGSRGMRMESIVEDLTRPV